ncbi:hypothetical protein BRD00_05965 [Halobacteriales archaeon QS_8_69_26]|nr:MAG: hypothetical protein BRD00_05965 [Halobacteriales archaeon QS_8_69_26]
MTLDPATLRLVGFAAVVLVAVGLLVFLVRAGGPSDARTGDRDSRGVAGDRPARRADRSAEGPRDRPGPYTDRRDRAGGEWGERGRPGADWSGPGYDPPGERGDFGHSVVGERRGELLVEVGDGRRAASFVVAEEGAATTVEPLADPARRYGRNWVADAERYLRHQRLDADAASAGQSGGVERRFGGETDDQRTDREFDRR